jgi:hypothetical protein
MASSKERDRWERWFNQMNERNERQKKIIDRLMVAGTAMSAALLEIARMDDETASARAERGIEEAAGIAAAARQSREELDSEAEPEDPRRNP